MFFVDDTGKIVETSATFYVDADGKYAELSSTFLVDADGKYVELVGGGLDLYAIFGSYKWGTSYDNPYTLIYKSTDKGETWSLYHKVSGIMLHDITYGNGYFVASAVKPAGIYYSKDMKSWTKAVDGVFNNTYQDCILYLQVCYNPTAKKFVAAGAWSIRSMLHAYVSSNGVSWTKTAAPQQPNYDSSGSGGGSGSDLYFDGTYYLYTQGGHKGSYSIDGVTWKQVNWANLTSDYHSTAVRGNGKTFILGHIGTSNTIPTIRYYTTDPATTTNIGVILSNPNNTQDSPYGNGTMIYRDNFILASMDGIFYRSSSDPTIATWTKLNNYHSTCGYVGDLQYFNGRYNVISMRDTGNNTYTSNIQFGYSYDNGSTWTNTIIGVSEQLTTSSWPSSGNVPRFCSPVDGGLYVE